MQVVEWTPQNDLLGDNRVKAFVTHGGLNSIYEVGTGPPLMLHSAGPSIDVTLFHRSKSVVQSRILLILSDLQWHRLTRLE